MAGYNNYKSFVFYGQQVKYNYWIEVEQDILLVGCPANNEIVARPAAGPSRPELAPGEMAARTPRRLGTKNPLSLQIEHDPFREIVSRLIRIGWADQKLEFVRLASSWDGHAPFLLSNMCRRQLDERKKKGKYYEVQQSKQIVIMLSAPFIFSRNTNSSGGIGLDQRSFFFLPNGDLSCHLWIKLRESKSKKKMKRTEARLWMFIIDNNSVPIRHRLNA